MLKLVNNNPTKVGFKRKLQLISNIKPTLKGLLYTGFTVAQKGASSCSLRRIKQLISALFAEVHFLHTVPCSTR